MFRLIHFFFAIGLITIATFPSEAHGPVHEHIERLNKLIKDQPQNAKLYVERASYYKLDLNFDRSLSDLLKAQSIEQDLPALNFLFAELYYDFDHYHAALFSIIEFEKTALIPAETFWLKSKIYNRLLEVDSAYKYAVRSFTFQTKPTTEFFLYIKDMSFYADKDNFQRAYDWLVEGKKFLPKDQVLYKEMVQLCLDFDRFNQAKQLCLEHIKSVKRKEAWYFKLASIEIELQNWSAAIQALDNAQSSIDKLPRHIKKTSFITGLQKKIDNMRMSVEQNETASNR